MAELEQVEQQTPSADPSDYAEFEIGEHRVPWFLWLFFSIIISWAAISWYPFFGY
jgi:hypothetical protein